MSEICKNPETDLQIKSLNDAVVAFRDLLKRSWSKRYRVVQEIALATKGITLQYGTDCIDWTDFPSTDARLSELAESDAVRSLHSQLVDITGDINHLKIGSGVDTSNQN